MCGQTLLRKALWIRDDKRPRLSSLIDNALRERVWPCDSGSRLSVTSNDIYNNATNEITPYRKTRCA